MEIFVYLFLIYVQHLSNQRNAYAFIKSCSLLSYVLLYFFELCLCYVLLCSMWLWEYMCPHCTWSQEAFCLAFGFHFCHGHKNEGFLKIGCWSGLSYLLLLFCSSYKHFFFLYKFVVFTENCSIFQKLHDLAAQWVSWHFLYSTPS